jgi:hypothetical protein
MSIKFVPSENLIELNEKKFSTKLECDDFVDMYVLEISNNKDTEILEVVKDNKPNTNANFTITMTNRRTEKDVVKEYKNGIEVNIQNTYNDIYYECVETILLETNVEKICLEIYKKHLEKRILARSNKFVNQDYLIDLYLLFSNNLHEEIYQKIKLYFEELVKNSNIKLHLVCVKPKNNDYSNMCTVS